MTAYKETDMSAVTVGQLGADPRPAPPAPRCSTPETLGGTRGWTATATRARASRPVAPRRRAVLVFRVLKHVGAERGIGHARDGPRLVDAHSSARV